MKREMLKGIKPKKMKRKEISYKRCKINYMVSDYGLGSSGVSKIIFFTHNEFGIVSVILDIPTKTLEEAEKKIIKQSKEWIDIHLFKAKNK